MRAVGDFAKLPNRLGEVAESAAYGRSQLCAGEGINHGLPECGDLR
jgi:hypothetical protein